MKLTRGKFLNKYTYSRKNRNVDVLDTYIISQYNSLLIGIGYKLFKSSFRRWVFRCFYLFGLSSRLITLIMVNKFYLLRFLFNRFYCFCSFNKQKRMWLTGANFFSSVLDTNTSYFWLNGLFYESVFRKNYFNSLLSVPNKYGSLLLLSKDPSILCKKNVEETNNLVVFNKPICVDSFMCDVFIIKDPVFLFFNVSLFTIKELYIIVNYCFLQIYFNSY